MSRSSTDKLSHEKIQQLLAAVGKRAAAETAETESVQDYDWRRPRYFKLDQLQRIEAFAETAAEQLQEQVGGIYREGCTVSAASVEQYYPDESDDEHQKTDYYLAFGETAEKPFGSVLVPQASALFWTSRILGDTASAEAADRTLSNLEESLLQDILTGLINAFAGLWGKPLYPIGNPVTDRSLFVLDGSDELFEIVYEIKSDASEITAGFSFLICCDKLEPVAGGGSTPREKLSDAQIRNAVLEHIHRVEMDVCIELGTLTLVFGDMMNLAVDDVVVLNRKVTDPVDVVIEGRTLFHGRPARSEGHHAVVIT